MPNYINKFNDLSFCIKLHTHVYYKKIFKHRNMIMSFRQLNFNIQKTKYILETKNI